MNFTEEHLAIKESMEKFITAEINPYVDEWEQEGIFPARELFKKLGNLGLLGVTKPSKFGGSELDYSYGLVLAEALGNIACAGIPMAIGVQTDMCTPALAKAGSDTLREEFLRPAIAGDLVGCIGVSETGAGSDVASIQTQARPDGDDYIINGSKMWITNATQADFICLLANTGEGNPHKNKSLIIVPIDLPGISVSAPFDKIGMRSSDTGQIFFDNVRVPKRNRIGEEGQGFILQMQQFQEERLFAAASCLRGMEQSIEKTIQYTKEREVFGQALIDNQSVHFKLAELQTEIEALRALTYRACELYINGEDVTKFASMAKLKAGRLSRVVSDACLQYWGGMGFMWENSVARSYRDSRLLSIGGGADEVMIGTICKYMGILPKR